jgi:hypothetical protein
MLLTTEVRVDGGYEVPGDGNIGPIKRSLIVEAIDAVFACLRLILSRAAKRGESEACKYSRGLSLQKKFHQGSSANVL